MLPQLRKLEEEFTESLVVIGVHSPKFPAEKQGDNLRKAILRHDLHHPVVNDAEFAVWQGFAVRAWPTLMIIDPRGYVIGKHEGEFDPESMRAFLHGAVASFTGEGGINRDPIAVSPETEETPLLRFPGKVLADEESDRLFIADSGHHRIIVTDLQGRVLEIFGDGVQGLTDGPGSKAQFRNPQGMVLRPGTDELYVADAGNHALRVIHLQEERVETVAGTGERGHGYDPGSAGPISLASPWDVTWHDGEVWIAMAGMHQIWTYDPADGAVRVAAGSGHESIHDGPLVSATFAQPSGITALDDLLYIADSETSAVRRIDPTVDRVRRLVGRGLFEFGDMDAIGDSVRLQHPLGVAATMESGRPVVYIADSYNDKIKRLDPVSREVTSIFGGGGHGLVDGIGDEAEFWEPGGISIAGRRLYIADTNNHAIRVADLDTGEVQSLMLEGL